MIWLPQFLFKISPLKSLYSAGRASLAFLPSRWNILTSTAFLFPKTTIGSCSAYFNPEKNAWSHIRLALHYYEGTPLLPQFLLSMNTQTHCIQISLFSVFSPKFLHWVSRWEHARLENEREGCRAENRLCLPFFMLQRVKLVFLMENKAVRDLV